MLERSPESLAWLSSKNHPCIKSDHKVWSGWLNIQSTIRKGCQPRIYLAKLFFKNKIKNFPDKQKLREHITTKFTLQEKIKSYQVWWMNDKQHTKQTKIWNSPVKKSKILYYYNVITLYNNVMYITCKCDLEFLKHKK